MISLRKSAALKSHTTVAGAEALLQFRDVSSLSGAKLGDAVKGMDVFRSDGGSFEMRPPSRTSIYRLDRKRLYCYMAEQNREIRDQIATGCVGVASSADLTSILGLELATSAFMLMFSLVGDALDIDGQPSYSTSLVKYENPLLALAGKGARDLADAMLALFKLRGLLPDDATVETCATKLHEAVVSWTSDQGSENAGGWRNVRFKEGDGGMFSMLFVLEKLIDGVLVRVRRASYQSCLQHDPQNLDHATVSHGRTGAGVETVAKHLREGKRLAALKPVVEYLCGVGANPFGASSPGYAILEAKKPEIVVHEKCLALIRTRPLAPAKTRFATINQAAMYQSRVRGPLAVAIAVVDGKRLTYQACVAELEKGGDGLKKSKKVYALLTDEAHAFHMALAEIKHDYFIWPIMAASALGSHCAAPLMGGKYGVISQTLRRLRRACHCFDLQRLKAKQPAYYAQLLAKLRVGDPTFEMPDAFGIPRASMFATIYALPLFTRLRTSPSAVPAKAVAVVMSWLRTLETEFEERIGRQAPRVEMRVAALAREYEFVLAEAEPCSSEVTAKRCWQLNQLRAGTCYTGILDLAVAPDARVVALAPLADRAKLAPTFTTVLEVEEARLLCVYWDGLSPQERAMYPPKLRDLLEPGELRRALDAFSRCEINARTGRPHSLRRWKALHEHVYAFCGVLFKTTSIDREWAFSVVKCYILRGNYHVGLERLSIQVIIAAIGSIPMGSMGPEQLRRGKELQQRVANWRQDQSGKARHLLHADDRGALAKLEFREIRRQIRDVPTLLFELFNVHAGAAAKMGIMKLATLARHYGATITGRVTKSRADEILRQWNPLQQAHDAAMRALAATAPTAPVAAPGDAAATSPGDTAADDDDGPRPDQALAALERKTYEDTSADPSTTWGVLRVGWDPETEAFVAYVYDLAKGQPTGLGDCEPLDAQELATASWAVWADAVDDADAEDDAVDADGAGDADGDEDDAERALEDERAFAEADATLCRLLGGCLWRGDDCDDESTPTVVVDFVGGPVDPLHRTAQSVPYRVRELLLFYEKASVRLDDESTEPIEVGRYPRVERKVCLVLQRRDDVFTLFCVEDLSRDADGVPYAHGAWLFRAAELPKATRELLPEGFDAGATLVESVNRQMAPLVEVFGSREVFASPTLSTETDDASEPVARVSTAVFVDEMMDGDKPWPLATEKTRDEPPQGPLGRTRRATNTAGSTRA